MDTTVFHDPDRGIRGYKANATFAKVHQDSNPYLFVRGPVGSGKSTGCVWHVFLNAVKQKPDYRGIRKSRYLIIRATYPSLKTTIVKTWQEYFGDFIKITFDTPFKGRLLLDLPDGTSVDMELNFLAVASEDEVQKLQSYEVTGVHVNEAHEIDASVIRMLKTRFGRYPTVRDGGPVDPFILCDYNSVDTEHWLYELAEEEKPEKHSFYSQPPAMLYKDGNYSINPDADNLENLRKDYYFDAVLGSAPDWINVFILNNYGQVRSGKPVYHDFDQKSHIATTFLQPLHGVQLVVGVDQGLTPSCVFTQVSPSGQLLILEEIITEDTSLRELCQDILKPLLQNKYNKWFKDENYICIIDPAALQRSQNDAKAAVDMFREAGLNYRVARSNVPAKRQDAVVYFLRKKDGFLISPTCSFLIKGFISEYKYEELRGSSSGMFKEKPMKNIYSHCHDALQYAALEHHAPRTKKIFKRKYRAASSIGGY